MQNNQSFRGNNQNVPLYEKIVKFFERIVGFFERVFTKKTILGLGDMTFLSISTLGVYTVVNKRMASFLPDFLDNFVPFVFALGISLVLYIAIKETLKYFLTGEYYKAFICTFFLAASAGIDYKFQTDGLEIMAQEQIGKKPQMNLSSFENVNKKYDSQLEALQRRFSINGVEIYNAKISANNAKISALESEIKACPYNSFTPNKKDAYISKRRSEIAAINADNLLQESLKEKVENDNLSKNEAYQKAAAPILAAKETDQKRIETQHKGLVSDYEKTENESKSASTSLSLFCIFGMSACAFFQILESENIAKPNFIRRLSENKKFQSVFGSSNMIEYRKEQFLEDFKKLPNNEKNLDKSVIAARLIDRAKDKGFNVDFKQATGETYITKYLAEIEVKNQNKAQNSQPLEQRPFSNINLEKDAEDFNSGKK